MTERTTIAVAISGGVDSSTVVSKVFAPGLQNITLHRRTIEEWTLIRCSGGY
jgi:tRNA U34 2-thiouridine synthase MnmA/TrmU